MDWEKGKNYTAPNSAGTKGLSINAGGDVTGVFADGQGEHGFVRDRNGNFTVFDAPNAGFSIVTWSINAGGDVTGVFADGQGEHGFVRSAH